MSGTLHLDHVVIATRELTGAADTFERSLGFNVLPGGRHVGRGTRNALVVVDDSYLELIAVDDVREAEAAGRGGLVRYLRGRRGGLAAVALEPPDIDHVARDLDDLGLDPVGPFPMERVQGDGQRVSWRLVVPGGDQYRRWWPFFIQWDSPWEARFGRGVKGTRHPGGVLHIVEVAIAVADLGRAKAAYTVLLGEETEASSDPDLAAERVTFPLRGAALTLLSPAGDGPVGRAIAAEGEGPYRVTLEVSSLAAVRRRLARAGASITPAPGVPSGRLVEPAVAGARIVLREPEVRSRDQR